MRGLLSCTLRQEPLVDDVGVTRSLVLNDYRRTVLIETECVYTQVGSSLRFRPADVAEYENRQTVAALGYAAQERPEPPRLNLAFPLKRRRSGRM